MSDGKQLTGPPAASSPATVGIVPRRAGIAEVESAVLTEYFSRLEASNDVPSGVIQKLDHSLSRGKLPKAEELVRLYREEIGDPAP
jgi:hypothetical protein